MSETTMPSTSAQPMMADTANAKPVDQGNGNAENATTGSSSAASADASAKKEVERKYKLKFGKTEREVSEKEALALAQKGWAADEKFQKAAATQKEVNAFIERMKVDEDAFDEFIKFLGKDPDDVYKKQLGKSLKRKVMTPEEAEREELRSKVQKYEAEKKAEEKRKHEEQVKALQEKYEQQYDKEMSEAIQGSGLPKTPKTVKRCAQIMYRALEQGYDLPWTLVVEEVRREYQEDMKEMFGNADADSLVKLFGDDIAKKFTSASLKKRVVDPEPVTEENRSPAKGKKTEEQPKYLSEQEFEAKLKAWKNS